MRDTGDRVGPQALYVKSHGSERSHFHAENPPSSYPLPLHVSPLNVFDLSVLVDTEMLFF